MAAVSDPGRRPVTVLVAALGGEGGGVLTDWLVAAASAAGLPVQSTSIPGVAQRTGATTYYLEIYPVPLDGRDPVLALHPCPGNVDLVVASELLEAARAMENGFVTPSRTTLLASTHRVFSIAEKSAMGDGSYDSARVLEAARELARARLLDDFRALAQTSGGPLNAVLLGLIAASDILPVTRAHFEEAIRGRGVAVEANLAAFAAGMAWRAGAGVGAVAPTPAALPEALASEVHAQFPAPARELVGAGVARLLDYQGADYARAYLARLLPVLALDDPSGGCALTRETARYLALWMSFEDVIRVADLKTRAARSARLREETGATAGEPVRVSEFLRPGVEELAALLPARLGARLRRAAERHPALARAHLGLRLRSDTLTGFLALRLLAGLRAWRPRSLRFAEEQATIERWLDALRGAARADRDLALEVAECANLNKGYGETFARGRGNFLRLLEQVIEPLLARGPRAGDAAWLRELREAALADPQGARLAQGLAAAGARIAAAAEAADADAGARRAAQR